MTGPEALKVFRSGNIEYAIAKARDFVNIIEGKFNAMERKSRFFSPMIRIKCERDEFYHCRNKVDCFRIFNLLRILGYFSKFDTPLNMKWTLYLDAILLF